MSIRDQYCFVQVLDHRVLSRTSKTIFLYKIPQRLKKSTFLYPLYGLIKVVLLIPRTQMEPIWNLQNSIFVQNTTSVPKNVNFLAHPVGSHQDDSTAIQITHVANLGPVQCYNPCITTRTKRGYGGNLPVTHPFLDYTGQHKI